MKRFLPLIAVLIVTVIALIRTLMTNPNPVGFSPSVSVIVSILLLLSLVVVLLLTIQGKLIGRRTVFVFIGVALILPFFMSFRPPIRVSPEVQKLYDALSGLPAGAKVLAAFDYDPPSAPELQPMADAFMKFAFKHDLKVIIMGLWPQGPQQANMSVNRALALKDIQDKNLKYGVDWVNLGFQAGGEFVIQRMGGSFRGMFPRDIYSTDYSALPLLEGVVNFSNIDLVMNFSSGYVGTVEWVQIAVDRFGVRVGACNTAVQAPSVYPYLSAGRLTGLAGGMSGAAELEKATGEIGKATTYILGQSFAHIVVIAFIIIGNVALFLGKRRKKETA